MDNMQNAAIEKSSTTRVYEMCSENIPSTIKTIEESAKIPVAVK
jgi:hypothetical protein